MMPEELLQDRYQRVERLGSGGQGSVYLATDRRLPGKHWAIKELREAEPGMHESIQRQFDEEARVLAHLDHQGLPRVSDYFTEGDRHYLVMEFVEGEDLDAVVAQQGGRLPERQAIEIARQLCDILEYLHRQTPEPVIHRDLKPANIKVAPDGRVRLVDFGLAKMATPGDPSRTVVRGSGTPGFSPLEQYGRGGTDQRCDVYALGCCLYFMLTGVIPPEAPDRSVNPRLLRPLRELNSRVSPELAQVVDKAMQLSASDRYQTAIELRRSLVRSSELVGMGGGQCVACGAQLAVGQKFCLRCGASADAGASVSRAIPFVLTGSTLGLGLAWFPLLLLPAPSDLVLTIALAGNLLFVAAGGSAGMIVGYRVAPARLLFMRQVWRLLLATLVAELVMGAIVWALLNAAGVALPREVWTSLAVWIGALVGPLALVKLPYVRRAWPQ